MSLFCLPAFVVALFVFESWRNRICSVSQRVERFSKGLDRLLLFIPVLAVVVFAVLFAFVLKGRFYERLCHAALVLAFWLYAARFLLVPDLLFRSLEKDARELPLHGFHSLPDRNARRRIFGDPPDAA